MCISIDYLKLAFFICIFMAFIIFMKPETEKNNPKDQHSYYSTFFTGSTVFVFFVLIIAYYIYAKGYAIRCDIEGSSFLDFKFNENPIGMSLILLSGFCFIAVAIYTFADKKYATKSMVILMLLSEAAIIVAFSANNLLMFFIAFEACVIPMFFMIGMYGGKFKVHAAYKLIVYTLVGSFAMLFAIIMLYIETDTLSILELQDQGRYIEHNKAVIVAGLLLFSFAIKIPMFPLHTWLPEVHVQAPTISSVLLAAILLKLGGYAMYSFVITIFSNDVVDVFSNLIVYMSVFAILYGSYVALGQLDIKKMIAYSSVAHMGYVTAGLFSSSSYGIYGAVIQMIAHGLSSGGLFICAGFLYRQTGTYKISDYMGVMSIAPWFGSAFMILTMASVGLPGTLGFVSEFLVILGLFEQYPISACIIAAGAFLSPMYMLSLYRRIIFGDPKDSSLPCTKLKDLTIYDIICLYMMIAALIFFGVFPFIMISLIGLSV